jgi:mono/diheme cytochrome c family protein
MQILFVVCFTGSRLCGFGHNRPARIRMLAASIPEYDYALKRAASLLACVALAALVAGCAKDRSNETDAELGLNSQQASGRHIFQQHCATCHSAYTSTGDHGPGLNKLFRKQFLPSGLPANERFVRQTILAGRGMMPSQAPWLTGQQLEDLLSYLHTL